MKTLSLPFLALWSFLGTSLKAEYGTFKVFLLAGQSNMQGQGVVDMEDDEARSLLREIHEHQIDDAVVYRHRWEPDMAVVWDNRSVLHRATGGYEGHDRLLRRTTIVR